MINLGIEIPGIHFQDQKYSNEDNWKYLETMNEQNMQLVIQQKIEQCKYIDNAETIVQRNLRVSSRGILHASQRD